MAPRPMQVSAPNPPPAAVPSASARASEVEQDGRLRDLCPTDFLERASVNEVQRTLKRLLSAQQNLALLPTALYNKELVVSLKIAHEYLSHAVVLATRLLFEPIEPIESIRQETIGIYHRLNKLWLHLPTVARSVLARWYDNGKFGGGPPASDILLIARLLRRTPQSPAGLKADCHRLLQAAEAYANATSTKAPAAKTEANTASSQTPAADTEANPSNSEAPAADTEANPLNSEAPAADTEANPLDSETPPADTEANPASPETHESTYAALDLAYQRLKNHRLFNLMMDEMDNGILKYARGIRAMVPTDQPHDPAMEHFFKEFARDRLGLLGVLDITTDDLLTQRCDVDWQWYALVLANYMHEGNNYIALYRDWSRHHAELRRLNLRCKLTELRKMRQGTQSGIAEAAGGFWDPSFSPAQSLELLKALDSEAHLVGWHIFKDRNLYKLHLPDELVDMASNLLNQLPAPCHALRGALEEIITWCACLDLEAKANDLIWNVISFATAHARELQAHYESLQTIGEQIRKEKRRLKAAEKRRRRQEPAAPQTSQVEPQPTETTDTIPLESNARAVAADPAPLVAPTTPEQVQMADFVARFFDPGTFKNAMTSLHYHFDKHAAAVPGATPQRYIRRALAARRHWRPRCETAPRLSNLDEVVRIVNTEATYLVFTQEGKILTFVDRTFKPYGKQDNETT